LNGWAKAIVPGLLTALVLGMVGISVTVIQIQAERRSEPSMAAVMATLALKAPLEGSAAVLARMDNVERQLARIEEKLDTHVSMHNPPAHDGEEIE
jgi:hypothetical protein